MMIQPDFSKYSDGLMPCIVQDDTTDKVLMLGFMNADALQATRDKGQVTFFSRSKNRLWTKGETSGNFLMLKTILLDCDQDSLLIKATPAGPLCHTGADTCFNEVNETTGFVYQLEQIISQRKSEGAANSYTSALFQKGINKIAQKVGEEAVEMVIESKDNNEELFLGEAADLLFHYLILLQAKGYALKDVERVLLSRHQQKI